MGRMGELDSAVATKNRQVRSVHGRRIVMPAVTPIILERQQPPFNRLFARLERTHRDESWAATRVESMKLRRQPWKT